MGIFGKFLKWFN